jgi:hypothetical protein
MHLATPTFLLGFVLPALRVGAQFPPPPKGLTVLKSKFHDNVTISFKEVQF